MESFHRGYNYITKQQLYPEAGKCRRFLFSRLCRCWSASRWTARRQFSEDCMSDFVSIVPITYFAVLNTMSTGWAANRPGADQPDVNKGPSLAAVSVALTVIASLIVSLRAWCRVRLLKSFGADVSRAVLQKRYYRICTGISLTNVNRTGSYLARW